MAFTISGSSPVVVVSGRRIRALGLSCAFLLAALVPGGAAPVDDVHGRVTTVVHQLGVGISVVAQPFYGDEIRGRIQSIDADSFVLTIDAARARRVAYSDVRAIALPRMRYRAQGPVDAQAIRHLLIVTGTGGGLEVSTNDGRTLRGQLAEFDTSHFVIGDPLTFKTVEVTYQQVAELGPKRLTGGQKAGRWVAVAGAAAGVTLFILWNMMSNN